MIRKQRLYAQREDRADCREKEREKERESKLAAENKQKLDIERGSREIEHIIIIISLLLITMKPFSSLDMERKRRFYAETGCRERAKKYEE